MTSVRQRKADAQNYQREDDQDLNGRQKIRKPGGLTRCLPYFGAFLVILSVVFLLAVIFIPSPIEPELFSLPEPPQLIGALTQNEHLTKAEHLFENKLQGPESVVVDGEHIYTGTGDGKVLHIYKGQIRTLAKLGVEPCGAFQDEPTCGRPLGMRLDKDGYLIVVDAYLGLFKVNVATGDVHQLYSSTIPINGKVPKFLNDLDIASDGKIYVSESSTKWQRRYNRYAILEAEASGRLLVFDPQTGTMTQLLDGFRFLNSVQLSTDNSHLLMTETTMARIHKYHLTGPKKGQVELIADNLPGLPDNIRRTSRGTYWVGCAAVRHSGQFSLLDFASRRMWLKKIFTMFFPQELIMRFIPKYGLLLEVDGQGNIVRSLHDPKGKVIPAVSEVEERNGVLYLGSYNLPYLSRLYLRQL